MDEIIGIGAFIAIIGLMKGSKMIKKIEQSQNKNDEMYGSVKPYGRHFIVIDGSESSDWMKKLEKGDNAVSRLSSMLKEAKETIGSVMVTAASPHSDEEWQLNGDKISIVVYPDEIQCEVRWEDIEKFGDFIKANSSKKGGKWNEAMLQSSGFAWKKVTWSVLVLVCAHKQRDALCGRIGPKIISFLKGKLTSHSKEVRVWATSHIGGHRFAGTLIIYPRATWLGRIKMHGKDQNGESVLETVLYDLNKLNQGQDCRMCAELDGIEQGMYRGNGSLVW